jgi:hypothetical protein
MTLIDPALIVLARLRFNAWLRRVRRGLSSRRGIAYSVIGAAVFVLWLLPMIISAMTGGDLGRPPRDPQRVREIMPLVLLGITLIMAVFSGGKIISFSAAEVDFLFPGPFSRHQLVLWKIAVSGFAALPLALIFSIWQVPNASMWIAAFLGIWLAWLLAQTLAMLILLARQAIMARRSAPVVRFGLIALLAVLLVAIIDILRPLVPMLQRDEFSLGQFLAHARRSLPGRIVLAPFDVLTMTFTAECFAPDLLVWGGVSVGMIAVLIWLVLRLDSHFIETSLRASEAVHAAVQRVKRGGNPFGGTSRPIASLRVPMLPWLGGVGPVAWRQMMLAARGARGLLLVLALLLLGLGPLVWMIAHRPRAAPVPQDPGIVMPLLILTGVWMVFLLPSMLRFDFRSDLAHIENLKLLPIAPTRIAIGQMIAPALVLSILAYAIIAALIASAPQRALVPGAIALAFVPPLTILLIGIENAAFLMFPTAQTMTTPGDMTMIGRSMVVFFVKGMSMALTLGVIGGLAALAFVLTYSWFITLPVAWALLTAAAAGIVPVVARLFAKFDPSMDRPAE